MSLTLHPLRRVFRLLAILREARLPQLRPLDIELAPLPESWPTSVKVALLAVLTLAHRAFAEASALAENSPLRRLHGPAENARLRAENEQLKRKNQLLRSRLERVDARLRPHYLAHERFQILALRLAAGWSFERTAHHFLVSAQTIASWTKRLDDDGLIAPPPPVNRFSDVVVLAIQQLKAAFPDLGRKKIAELLARAGLTISASTVLRATRKKFLPVPSEPTPSEVTKARSVVAKEPHHLWHLDLTTVPTSLGLATSWIPFAFPPVFPFAYKVAVVLDHFTRQVVGIRAFEREPTSLDVANLLDDVVQTIGKAPRHIVTDKGSQFFSSSSRKPAAAFADWCAGHDVRSRFGAVGQHGSIAIVERFIRTLKSDGLRRFLVPRSVEKMNFLLCDFVDWYNQVRPHAALSGLTPREKLDNALPIAERPRFETRARFPIAIEDAHRVTRVSNLRLVVSHFRDRDPLPVVSLEVERSTPRDHDSAA